MASGYPFDIPPPDANVLTYAALAYHLPLIISFSVAERTQFVWGGCMLLPLTELRAGAHGILAAWADGGYSDDLIVAAKCTEHGLFVASPACAVFPQRITGAEITGRGLIAQFCGKERTSKLSFCRLFISVSCLQTVMSISVLVVA